MLQIENMDLNNNLVGRKVCVRHSHDTPPEEKCGAVYEIHFLYMHNFEPYVMISSDNTGTLYAFSYARVQLIERR